MRGAHEAEEPFPGARCEVHTKMRNDIQVRSENSKIKRSADKANVGEPELRNQDRAGLRKGRRTNSSETRELQYGADRQSRSKRKRRQRRRWCKEDNQ